MRLSPRVQWALRLLQQCQSEVVSQERRFPKLDNGRINRFNEFARILLEMQTNEDSGSAGDRRAYGDLVGNPETIHFTRRRDVGQFGGNSSPKILHG